MATKPPREKPEEQRSGRRAEGGRAPEAGEDRGERAERFGSVSLIRHRKEDGRALILYSHLDDERPKAQEVGGKG